MRRSGIPVGIDAVYCLEMLRHYRHELADDRTTPNKSEDPQRSACTPFVVFSENSVDLRFP
jgi:hypothetical protein